MAKTSKIDQERESAALIDRYIERDPHRPGRANARLKDYGVHVWALVGNWTGESGDLVRIAREYRIPLEAAEAAMLYYERNQGPIDYKLEEMSGGLD